MSVSSLLKNLAGMAPEYGEHPVEPMASRPGPQRASATEDRKRRGSSYVYDTTVPNGRYIVPGDLAVVRDNRIVFGAGWIDSIEAAPGRKIRYRCPNCTSTDFKHRSKRQHAYRCAACTAEFDVPAEEELTVQVFTV